MFCDGDSMILKTTGATLFYEKSGDGLPIILLHGNGEDHKIFKETIALLEKHFCVYAIDTRGHGQSSPVAEFHYEDMANDIYEFICKLELEKPIVYGFSDGGIVALLLSIRHPELLSKIIVSGINVQPDGMEKSWIRLFKFGYFFTRSKKIKLMIEEPNITDEMLSHVTIPVFMTAGTKDMVKQSHIKEISDKLKNCSLTIFPGESHGSYVVNCEKIAKYILETCIG